MNTADFTGELTSSGQIAVPPEIVSQVPHGEPIRIVLQWGTSEEDAAWREVGMEQFAAAYSADDSVYEQLIHDPAAG